MRNRRGKVNSEAKEKKPKVKADARPKKEKVKKIKEKKPRKKMYVSYSVRIILYAATFMILLCSSILLAFKSMSVSEGKVSNYQESGSIDYKVYCLKFPEHAF